jgi:hypothetical protein
MGLRVRVFPLEGANFDGIIDVLGEAARGQIIEKKRDTK